jgi:hypothetical protein
MAQQKAQEKSREALEREAVNAAAEASRAHAARANAEKQKRFRERMKADGYREVKTWEKPLPPGMVKVSALIQECSLGIGDKAPAIQAALGSIIYEAVKLRNGNRISTELYTDIVKLLQPLGDHGFEGVSE